MNATFQILTPQKVVCSLTLTMTLEDFKRLSEQLNASASVYPAFKVQDAIRQLSAQAEARFTAKGDSES